MPDMVAIDAIIADSRCQSRTGIGLALVQEYADAIREGAALPPLSTIRADEGYYVYDGFHRLEAYRQVGRKDVAIESEPGDVWDAIERSCAVNATHGQRRTPADVKNAVKKIIDVMHHRGVRWSQGDIAARCAVSQSTVSRVLSDDPSYAHAYDSAAPATTVTRNGKQYEMNTANIGKKPAWQAPKMPTVPPIDPGPDVDDDDEEAGFVCNECGEIFSVEVWHCPQCDHHWSDGDDTCKNCYRPREGFLEDEEDESTPEANWSVVGMNILRYERLPEPHQRARAIVREIVAHEGESFLSYLITEAENHIS